MEPPQSSPLLLISDDEPLLVASLQRLAERAGMRCIVDTTSQSVLALAREHRPDVVVLDIRQRVDGRDLLAQLKRDPATRDIHVVVLSAVEDQFTRHVCFELGAEAYEVKPFDSTFIRRVARLVEQRRQTVPPPAP